jgi:hypothetical protein
MEICECLHKQADVFIHNCANAIWSLKNKKNPPFFFIFFFWLLFFDKKNLITLQKQQVFFILSRTIAISLATS